MSKAGANQNEIQKLLDEIDDSVTIDDIGKEARLSDAKNNLTSVQADLIGLRRMLVQHPRPDAQIQELGNATLGQAIRDKIKQAKRLSDYIGELEQLPDDPPVEDEKAHDANGHAELQDSELSDRLEEEKLEEEEERVG